jgi:hypothetical protein
MTPLPAPSPECITNCSHLWGVGGDLTSKNLLLVLLYFRPQGSGFRYCRRSNRAVGTAAGTNVTVPLQCPWGPRGVLRRDRVAGVIRRLAGLMLGWTWLGPTVVGREGEILEGRDGSFYLLLICFVDLLAADDHVALRFMLASMLAIIGVWSLLLGHNAAAPCGFEFGGIISLYLVIENPVPASRTHFPINFFRRCHQTRPVSKPILVAIAQPKS